MSNLEQSVLATASTGLRFLKSHRSLADDEEALAEIGDAMLPSGQLTKRDS